MRLGEEIKRLRKAAGIKQNELAERIGVSQPFLSEVESGKKKSVGTDVLFALADVLGVPTDHFREAIGTGGATGTGKKKAKNPKVAAQESAPTSKPGVKSASVAALPPLRLRYRGPTAAGKPIGPVDEDREPIDLTALFGRQGLAAWSVVGDSMIGDGIKPGDWVVIEENPSPEPGNKVLAVVDGGLTVKRLRQRGKKLVLCAYNPSVPDIVIEPGRTDARILGTVYGVIRIERRAFR